MERRWLIAGAAGVALLGIALRLWHSASTPLWLDEAYSAYAADHSFAFLWQVVPRYETHPPFYYSLLRCWTLLFGDGLIALRAPGLIAGVATPPVVALAALQAGAAAGFGRVRRQRLAFAAFALACLSIPLVEMAREVRPYPIMILTYALATMVLVRIARRAGAGLPLMGRAYMAYLVLLALILWLHNLGALYAAAMGLALLATVRRTMPARDWAWLVGGHVLVALAWVPALLILRDQAPTWVSSTWLRFGWASALGRVQSLYVVPGWQGLAGLVLAGLALAALARGSERRRLAGMLLALALVPILLSLTISSLVAPVFIMRTMTPIAAPAIVLLVIGAVAWTDMRRWLGLGAALILGANMLAVDLQARAGPPMQDWYGTVAWLRRHFRPGDLILAYPNEGALPLRYALRDEGLDWPIRPVPTAVPSLDVAGGWYPTGSRGVVSLPRPQLHAIAEQPGLAAVPTIWLLRLGPETYDPDDVFLEELHRGRAIVRHWTDGPIDIVGLSWRDRSPPAPARNRR